MNDWTLTGVLTLQSGMPIAVTQATNNNAFAGFGTQRPNLTGDPTLPADERSVSRWFNTGAFTTAPQFTIGTSSRNPVRGPGYRNLDMAVIRRVPLPASKALEVRAEVFNLTNTPPFGAPNGVVRLGGIRHDHVRRRSARRAAGAQVCLLRPRDTSVSLPSEWLTLGRGSEKRQRHPSRASIGQVVDRQRQNEKNRRLQHR